MLHALCCLETDGSLGGWCVHASLALLPQLGCAHTAGNEQNPSPDHPTLSCLTEAVELAGIWSAS